MVTLTEILFHVGNLTTKLIKKELVDQGHYLTGKGHDSITFTISKGDLTVVAAPHIFVLNRGVPPEQVSFKMLPALMKYFRLRGFSGKDPRKIAALTIKKWQKEGMSTEASQRYSRTGERQGFIDKAVENPKIEEILLFYANKGFDDEFSKSKSETI